MAYFSKQTYYNNMKKITTIFLLICISFTSASCKKEPPIVPIHPSNPWDYNSKLDVKWYTYFYSDTAGAYMHVPYPFDNHVVFCSRTIVVGDDNKGLGIGVYNKQTGEKHPLWTMDPSASLNMNINISDWLIGGKSNKYALFFSGNVLNCFDLSTGSMVWSNQIKGSFRISSFGDYVFQSNENNAETLSNLVCHNINDGSFRTLYTVYMTNGYTPCIEPPSGWISPTGDTVLVFQNRQWNFPLSKGKIDIYAYNMTRDSVMWVVEDLTFDGHSSIFKPIVAGDRMFFQGMKSNHCINLLTGKVVWSKEYPHDSQGMVQEGFAVSNNLYADGKLFSHSGSGSVIAYDANTGVELWKTSRDYDIITEGNIGYYNGKVYFNANDKLNYQNRPNYLFCLDANSGSLIWKDSGVVQSGMKGGIYIDQATGLLYAQDSYRVMCIDLNKTPRLNTKN
jgi:outer membrane protein assembly factor BamB